MKHRTLIAGVGVAGLALATAWLLRSPEKGSRGQTDRPPPPVGKLTEGSFDTIEVVRGGQSIGITRADAGYAITKPAKYPADQAAAKQAFEAVTNAEWLNPISDQKSRHAELEVGVDGLRVVLRKGERPIADFRIGKTIHKLVMVRVERQDEVWSASGITKTAFDKELAAWRDKTITRFDPANADKLLVTSRGGALILLSRQAGPDGGSEPEWRVLQSSVKVEPLDQSVPSDMVKHLAGLSASDFADDAKAEQTGLNSPDLVVAVMLRDGSRQSVLIGRARGEDEVYVKRADGPQVFVVKKYSLDRVAKLPIDFRRTILCDLTADEIVEIRVTQPKDSFTLVKQGHVWEALRPAGFQVDDSKVARVVAGLSGWKAQGYAEDASTRVTGLSKPVATVLAKAADSGRSCRIRIGGETPDKSSLYVAAGNLPDVFVVPKWSVGQVVVRLEGLKPK